LNIKEKFAHHLTDIVWPTEKEEKEEYWNVSGIIKNRSNQHLKFDVRIMFNMPKGELGKKGTTLSKADKMVFETSDEWIVVDLKELHQYIKTHKLTVIALEDIVSKLDWNIFLPKTILK